jgi:hypothetical protein
MEVGGDEVPCPVGLGVRVGTRRGAVDERMYLAFTCDCEIASQCDPTCCWDFNGLPCRSASRPCADSHLVRVNGRVVLCHQANVPSRGNITDAELLDFLKAGGMGPQKQELLWMIETLVDDAT